MYFQCDVCRMMNACFTLYHTQTNKLVLILSSEVSFQYSELILHGFESNFQIAYALL